VVATEEVSRFSRCDWASCKAVWSVLVNVMGVRVVERGKRVYPERDGKLKKKK
jgi:hypothetical protein